MRPSFWIPALLLLYALALFGSMAGWLPAAPHASWATAAPGFADGRSLWGLPHAADTLSNLPFALMALVLWRHLRAHPGVGHPATRRALGVLLLGLLATALGSALYHWAPSAERLVADRAGMALLFAGVLGLAVAERGSTEAVRPLLALMLPLGLLAAALPWWGWLAPWGLVQYGGVLGLLVLALRPLRPGALGVRWAWVLLAYGLAKACEELDAALFLQTGGWISGHTLKHLVAAAALLPVLGALRRRA